MHVYAHVHVGHAAVMCSLHLAEWFAAVLLAVMTKQRYHQIPTQPWWTTFSALSDASN
jgi:hypothetical protein